MQARPSISIVLATAAVALAVAIAAPGCNSERAARREAPVPGDAHVHDPDEPSTAHRPSVRWSIQIDDRGISPSVIQVMKGQPVELTFSRGARTTCGKAVLVHFSANESTYRELPLGEPISIAGNFDVTGRLLYACDARSLATISAVP